MFIVIENGEVYGPEPLGRVSVLLNGGTILKIGEVDASAIDKSGLPIEFLAYSQNIHRATERLSSFEDSLLEVPFGGTAVGTGTNTNPGYAEKAIENLREITGLNEIELPALQPGSSIMPGKVKECEGDRSRRITELNYGESGSNVNHNWW